MQRQGIQILKNKPKYKSNSIQPSKTSPPLATIAEMGEKLWKGNIIRSPSWFMHFSWYEWNQMHLSNDE